MLARTTTLFLAGVTFGFGGALSAWAESATTRPPAGRLEQRDLGTGPAAPVGRRQPHAKDVAPAEMPPADQATRDLDKALEKKLTICRGC
jgi:hypothetical protein